MKCFFGLAVCLVLGFSGCAGPAKVTTLGDAVGPVAQAGPSLKGTLVVYTPTMNVFNDSYPPHMPYEIYGKDGKLLQKVRNHDSNSEPGPEEVLLAPGEYKIKSDSRDGMLMIPVIIEARRKTVLNLNGRNKDKVTNNPSEKVVRSASGDIIGVKAPVSVD